VDDIQAGLTFGPRAVPLYSAQVAGLLGLPFAFAHHFSPANTLAALALYREQFRPSEMLERPHAMVAAAVI
jgi:hypothetical protein